jgi:hypothetical protein
MSRGLPTVFLVSDNASRERLGYGCVSTNISFLRNGNFKIDNHFL